MREDTITTTVYKFDELSDEAKQAALEKLYNLNVSHDWWEHVYEDAATIGLVIEEFDIDRDSFCRGRWTEDAEDTARLIIEHHGETCETHKDATLFLADRDRMRAIFEAIRVPPYNPDYFEYDELDEYTQLCGELQHDICEDYRIMLQKEYEYQTSKEAIVETIEANEYDFTVDGKLY